MNITCLGAGAWGIALAQLLASKGHKVKVWSKNRALLLSMQEQGVHPRFLRTTLSSNIDFTSDFEEALENSDFIVEAVTSKGVREIFNRLKGYHIPLIMTSKGIEESSLLLVPEVALEIFGGQEACRLVYLSGPSFASEVMALQPTVVEAAAFSLELAQLVADLFSTDFFHVRPSEDMIGAAFGGAMKNVIAIACGIAEGLGFKENCRAALMTFGMEEIRQLALVKPAMNPSTLFGLTGLGDFCLTCQSIESRNYKFGKYLGLGFSVSMAREKVGMVVEGEVSAKVAWKLALEHRDIEIPMIQAICKILEEKVDPRQIMTDVLKGAVCGPAAPYQNCQDPGFDLI